MQRFLSILFLIVVAFALYFSALSFEFAWLDDTEILGGKLIANNLQEAFRMWLWDDGNYTSYHRPVYNWMHSIDWAIWGKNAFGFHLSSLVIHILNGILFFTLLRRLTTWTWGAFLLCLLWLVIPVHVPTVALIHAKGDLLSTLFLLTTFHLLLFEKKGWHLLGGFTLLLALGSKEVALAGVLFMTIYFFRKHQKQGTRWIAIIAPTLLYLVFRLLSTSEHFEGGQYVHRILTFPLVYGSYFWESMSGLRLSISDTVISWGARDAMDLVIHLVMLFGAMGIQWWSWKKVPESRAFILLFNLFLLPVSQIIPTLHFRADRFLYMASFGWLGMWATLTHHYLGKRNLSMVAGGIIGIYFFWQSQKEMPFYQNSESLFSRTIELEPANREARGYMGLMASLGGDESHAIFHYTRALNGNPSIFSYSDRHMVRANMAVSQMRLFQYDAALNNFLQSYEALGQPVNMDFNIGLCYKNTRQSQKAYEHFVRFQRRYPEDMTVMEKLVEVYVDMGKRNKAMEEINRILRIKPDHPHAAALKDAMIQLQNAR